MNVWIEVKRTKVVGRIIGWCPDKKGRPNAMVQIKDKVFAFKLREFVIVEESSLKNLRQHSNERFNWFESNFDRPLPRA